MSCFGSCLGGGVRRGSCQRFGSESVLAGIFPFAPVGLQLDFFIVDVYQRFPISVCLLYEVSEYWVLLVVIIPALERNKLPVLGRSLHL